MDARKLSSCSFSHSYKHGLLGTLVLALSFSNYGNYHISYYGWILSNPDRVGQYQVC